MIWDIRVVQQRSGDFAFYVDGKLRVYDESVAAGLHLLASIIEDDADAFEISEAAALTRLAAGR